MKIDYFDKKREADAGNVKEMRVKCSLCFVETGGGEE